MKTDPRIDHLEEFYGLGMRPTTLDAIVGRFVPPADFSIYPELVETKWFGYRTLSPGQSLFLFMDRYKRAYKKIVPYEWGNLIQITVAGGISTRDRGGRTIRPDLFRAMRKGEITCFWRAMAHADANGIPYDFYCETLIKLTADLGWKNPPIPSQLYRPRMTALVIEKWQEQKRHNPPLTKHAFFQARAYKGHRWQNQYADYLIEHVNKSENRSAALAYLLFEKGAIPPARAAQKLDATVIRSALESHKRLKSLSGD